jgi:hypothetical protein
MDGQKFDIHYYVKNNGFPTADEHW